jgi:hypothetical protein
VVAAWPSLPVEVQQAVLAIVREQWPRGRADRHADQERPTCAHAFDV